LRRRRQIADRHVLDHLAAKRAHLSHRKTSCLKGWAAREPTILSNRRRLMRPPLNCRVSGFVQSTDNRQAYRPKFMNNDGCVIVSDWAADFTRGSWPTKTVRVYEGYRVGVRAPLLVMLKNFLTDELALAIAIGGEPNPLGGAQCLANRFELGGLVSLHDLARRRARDSVGRRLPCSSHFTKKPSRTASACGRRKLRTLVRSSPSVYGPISKLIRATTSVR
jgi:hypothetical protein